VDTFPLEEEVLDAEESPAIRAGWHSLGLCRCSNYRAPETIRNHCDLTMGLADDALPGQNPAARSVVAPFLGVVPTMGGPVGNKVSRR
jgi:hypothetical protein